MPRPARILSPTGMYHVMIRGVGKKDLFVDDADRYKFLRTLSRYKENQEFKLPAYCLMGNHVHLLFIEDKKPISYTMHRIGISFSYYHNKKNQWVGHVFQGRFRSEIITDLNHFMTCAKYIHNNPVAAGVVSKPEQFRWSSYLAYITDRPDNLVDTEILLNTYAQDRMTAIQELRKFTAEAPGDEAFIEPDDNRRSTDALRKKVASYLARGGSCIDGLKTLPRPARAELIRDISRETKATARELEEVLGISKSTIARYNQESG